MTSLTSRKTVKLNQSEPKDTDEYLCGPCNVENKTNQAVGYCQYCRHYLCTSCYSYHKNLGKIHALLNRDSMPRAVPEYKHLSDPCIETCKDHKHKTIELYCKNHDEVCCVICVTLHHKKCDYVYIPDVTESSDKTLPHSSTTTLKMIQALIGQYETSVTELSHRTIELDKRKKEFGSSMRKYKKEINEFLEDLEKQVMNEMRQTYETETKLISENMKKCEEAMKSLGDTYTKTKAVTDTDKPNKVFTITKMSQKHVKDMEACLKTVQHNTYHVEMKLEPNLEIMRALNKVKSFGKMVYKRTAVKFPPGGKETIHSDIGKQTTS